MLLRDHPTWRRGRRFRVLRPSRLEGWALRPGGGHTTVRVALATGDVIVCQGVGEGPFADGAQDVFFADPREGATDRAHAFTFKPAQGPWMCPEPKCGHLEPVDAS